MKYIMAAGVGASDGAAESVSDIGLVSEHSYSIIAANAVTDSDGNDITLMQIRNPWG